MTDDGPDERARRNAALPTATDADVGRKRIGDDSMSETLHHRLETLVERQQSTAETRRSGIAQQHGRVDAVTDARLTVSNRETTVETVPFESGVSVAENGAGVTVEG
ncbi:hypothetical protein [Halorussus halobius]|uniref:hypothetical protein n=1 Tax=Halorussus halobius TaxID=1710537 RepID=UPI001091BD9D|nr:hypothetical protein [Halorussus halobius]